MKKIISTKLVLILSLIVMFLLPAGNGCKGRTADQPSAQINVNSRQIAYGNVVLNNSTDQTVSIQNTGSISLNIGQIAQTNPHASPFSIVSAAGADACSGQAVQPSATCSFQVRFNPTSPGSFNDSFDIPSDASNENPVTVIVTGSGALRVAINQVKIDSCPTGVLELIATVTGANNTSVTGLAAGNFQLKENGVTQPIDFVSQITSTVPISVAMVLDYTTSIQSQIPTIEAASKDFVGMLTLNDEASIIKFAQFPQLMQDFTGDQLFLRTAIDTAPTTSIGRPDETRLYDALGYAVGQTAPRLKQKAIVLVSDGWDETWQGVPNASVNYTMEQVIAYATAQHVAIYTVGLGEVVNDDVMDSLARETGGQYYHIITADQLADVYQAISNILLGQYSIKYVSSMPGGIPFMLEIDVVGANEGVGVLQTTGCP